MFPALLTSLLYSLSIVFASRSTKHLGAPLANCVRLLVGLALLATWNQCFGASIPLEERRLLWLSGFAGITFGDIALFGALERIGPRLTLMLNQCLAAPMALLIGWLWQGRVISATQMLAVAAILFGVALALKPDDHLEVSRRGFGIGVFCGLLAALGQACGATISSHAAEMAQFDGGSAAFQRMLAGTMGTLLFYGVAQPLRIKALQITSPADSRQGLQWAFFHALCGPALGIACFQWAVAIAPPGIVLAIVSTSPLLAMFWLWILNGHKPPRGAGVGALLAVCGVVALQVLR